MLIFKGNTINDYLQRLNFIDTKTQSNLNIYYIFMFQVSLKLKKLLLSQPYSLSKCKNISQYSKVIQIKYYKSTITS